ncbi:MAG: hypothetical protein K2M97_07365, partial [Muribaculaceae bacterium]|nr:hypothetical protein [Muribaculaceae bacterium]
GDTLAELIKRGDSRLKSRKFVRRLLCELIDAVDYLHNRNIVHCDIKADNIIISPYADRPITLLDLDKAYSPWLDSTHGNAAKYGCDSCSDGAIDFKGVGLIARKLGMKRMAKACNRAGVSADFLRQQLADRSPGWLITALVVAIVLGTSVAVMLWYGAPTENKTAPAASDSIIATDTLPESVPAENLPKSAIDTASTASVIAEHLGNDDEYRMKLLAMLDCDTIPNREKADSINAYQLNYLAAVSKIINTAVTHYGDISESDVQKAVRNHPEWLRLEKEQEKMLIRLQKLYEVKGAQRLSVRPASQPDTLQGDILPAPRH